MASFCSDNRDVACYVVTKHSWKGRYKRIFSIGTLCVTTYNPQTLEITNQWLYEDFISIKNSPRNAATDHKQDEFIINVKHKGKRDNMRFSSDYTTDIISDCLQYFSRFAEKPARIMAVSGFKVSWTKRQLPVTLRIVPYGIEQLDRNVVVATYLFKDIKNIVKVNDCPGGLVFDVGEHRRRHLFASDQCEEILNEARRVAAECIGIVVPCGRESLSLEDFAKTRLGLCSREEQLASYVEFKNVQKFSPRHEPCARRLLCLSETCLIERDPATYDVICATPLKQVLCAVRLDKDPQQLVVEFVDGRSRAYSAPDRDLILASLVDGAKAAGNTQVFVTGHRFDRSLRLLPHVAVLDEDGESQCMRHIIAPPPGLRRADLIRRFNANIPYNGLTYSTNQERFFTENKGKIIVQCLEAVLQEKYAKDETNAVHKVEAQLQCLHRLFASKSGYHSFTEVAGIREKLGDLVVKSLQWRSEAIDHATVEALCALMHPMHNNYELRTEQLNKQSLLSSTQFVEHLLDLVVKHVERSTGALVIASMLDFLTYAVCAPYSETTAGETFDAILKLVAQRGRAFYALFHSPSMTIVKGAGMVMRAIIEESDVETSKQMQLLALSQGAFIAHLQMALLSKGTDLRVLTNKQLSGHLLSLWLADNTAANDLMGRCVPRGLLDFLESNASVPLTEADLLTPRNNLEAATSEQRQKGAVREKVEGLKVTAEAQLERFIQNWDLEHKLNFTMPRRAEEKNNIRPVVLRRRRQRVRPAVNWRLFAYQFANDHSKADLIWNEKTRDEFRHALENEIRSLENEKELAGTGVQISWNHTEFRVVFASLKGEVRIGDYFLRLLLAEADEQATPIHNPIDFFNNVFHRFLLSKDVKEINLRCQCLKAMAVTYGRHHMSIGAVGDAEHLVDLLRRSTVAAERDHLLLLLSRLALNKENVRQLLAAGLLPLLVDFSVLSHLHVQRAAIKNQTNVIEASSSQASEGGAAEWYFKDKEGNQHGPVSFQKMKELYASKDIFEKTKVWAIGMYKWESLFAVPQFRWTICSHEASWQQPPLYNFTELATLCLDVLIQMCEFFPSRDESDCVVRPMPSVKKSLTEPSLLYQVVQLLLTYDPAIVQRVASLLMLVMEDNLYMPRLYLSGVFFFILMYNGSNVLPIARFLHLTHAKQAFRSSLPKWAGVSHSVLAPLLPEAAIFYLEHYGPDRYAEVFLGEFDNPEIIWNNEMRRHLIEKIALHVSDFSHRLTSNVKALYEYCPIAEVDYPELENELFCHVYYLRHLCDRQRFPEYPIRDPIPFLRSCLAAWLEEIDKKEPAMSVEKACEALELSVDSEAWKDSAAVRRAYFKLASKYHPDKNPEGREMFEEINKAYELLSSNKGRPADPDAQRIVLCLQAQSIIYSRHLKDLEKYKYAGYGQLIKTIDMEARDTQLFQKGGGALLSAAIELANYTLMSTPTNAEELRRENGLEALQRAFDRCVPMISLSSKVDDMPVQVCEHICACFGTSARFEGCRQRVAEMTTVFGNLCRLLQFPHLTRLASAAAACISNMAVDTLLQTQLFQTGVLWQLVPHLFHFDFTLDEGGVSHSEDSNKQSLANRLARVSCEALASLAGFRETCPDNDGVQNSLRALLTPYVSHLMRTADNDVVLKTLNSNSCDPYLIWDNGTRAELLEFVERHRTSTENTSELFGAEFELSVHAKELIVGDVFIRIYNEQPNFVLKEAKKVCSDVLDYIDSHADELCGVPKKANGNLIDMDIDWDSKNGCGLSSDYRVDMCFSALSNLLVANPGVEVLMIGRFPLLVRFLRCSLHEQLQLGALKVLALAVANKQCVQDIGSVRICSTLFTLLVSRPNALPNILNILLALTASGHLVKEMLEYGGVAYLLHVFVSAPSADPTHRVLSAELLAKLQADRLTGPRWARFITKFLPPIFADALRDSPSTAITMLDSTNKNPELIWNDDTRGKVKSAIEKSRNELYDRQCTDPDAKWDTTAIAEDSFCAYADSVTGELVVGGVFIRLFVANPGWTVRHPKHFCTELIEKVLELMHHPNADLQLVCTAFVELMRYNPSTADQLPAQGYLPQFCHAMSARDPAASRAAILILQQLAENQFCADALCRLNCIQGIKLSMENQPTLMRESAHALKCLMKRQTGELAAQMLSTGMVAYLLEVLAGHMDGVSNASAAKAEIVDALKSACLDLKVGQDIANILESSPIWAQYKDQRHDLFLPAARTAAITQGAGGGVAGYLTDGMFSPPPMATLPPPLDSQPPPL